MNNGNTLCGKAEHAQECQGAFDWCRYLTVRKPIRKENHLFDYCYLHLRRESGGEIDLLLLKNL
jgi:hypothetical protein